MIAGDALQGFFKSFREMLKKHFLGFPGGSTRAIFPTAHSIGPVRVFS